MGLVRVGRVGRVHGVKGEIGLHGCSFTPQELQRIASFVWRGRNGEQRAFRLASARPAHSRLLVRFEGCENRDAAAALANGVLLTERERLPRPGPGEAYTFELIGLEVATHDGRRLGTLEDIVNTGAHPVYVVKGERELLVPASPQVLRKVDLEQGVITVELPDGLEEL